MWSELWGFFVVVVLFRFCLSGAFNADNAAVPCEVQCCFFQNDLCICVREDASAMRGAGMDPTEWPQAALTLAREDLGLGIFSAPFPPAPFFGMASPCVLIDWECHLQCLKILLPTRPPGSARPIVCLSGRPSVKHCWDLGALLSRDPWVLSSLPPTPKSCQS